VKIDSDIPLKTSRLESLPVFDNLKKHRTAKFNPQKTTQSVLEN